MALIEVFHVVASELPIDASVTTDIPQGVLVGLTTSGNVTLCDGQTLYPIGIAGDSRSQGVTSYTPESGSSLSDDPTTSLTGALVIGAQSTASGTGASYRFTQNRVADLYNEVQASGKMTVYHSGGEFWTDQYELIHSNGSTASSFVPGTRLWASKTGETTNATENIQRAGRFTDEQANINYVAGFTLLGPTAYPSGVPGVDVAFQSGLGGGEGGNSLEWGSFLHLKLSI